MMMMMMMMMRRRMLMIIYFYLAMYLDAEWQLIRQSLLKGVDYMRVQLRIEAISGLQLMSYKECK